MERLLRQQDIAAMLGTSPGVAASILAARGVHPIDFGIGRSRGRRWLSSAVKMCIRDSAGTALFDSSRLDGNPVTVDEAAGAVADAVHKPEEDVDWGEDSPSEAEAIGIALHKRYCQEIAPKQQYVAVEAKCTELKIPDIGIALTGTTDRVTFTDNGYGIADLTTGRTAVAADGTVTTAGHARCV